MSLHLLNTFFLISTCLTILSSLSLFQTQMSSLSLFNNFSSSLYIGFVLLQLYLLLHKLLSLCTLTDDTRNHFHLHSQRFPAIYVIIHFIYVIIHFNSQGFSASYVIIDESEGRDYEYIDKTIPS